MGTIDMSKGESKMIRRRSLHNMKPKAGTLTVDTIYEVSPRRRMRKHVSAPQDQVELTQHRPRSNSAGPSTPRRASGRRQSGVPRAASKGPVPKCGTVRHSSKRRVNRIQDQDGILHHADAESGLPGHSSPLMSPNERSALRDRRSSRAETVLRRREDEPIGLTIDEHLVVTNVVEGTAAHAAGLQPGTKLATLDGVRVTSQQQAVDVLRKAGDAVSIGLAQEATSSSLRFDGTSAGLSSSRDQGLTGWTSGETTYRRQKRGDPTKDGKGMGVPPYGAFDHHRTPHPERPDGLGPPGLGPNTEWAEQVDAETPQYTVASPGDDLFKPNLYSPPQLGRSPSRSIANKTSYEVYRDAGREWSVPSPKHTGKNTLTRLKDVMESKNGNIFAKDAPPSEAGTPSRSGRSRGASPVSTRQAAVGALPGWNAPSPAETSQRRPSGRRQQAWGRDTRDMLSQEGPAADRSPRRSKSAGATPRRAFMTDANCHGDLIGDTHGTTPAPSPRGRRHQLACTSIDLPKPKQRSFTPTARHQVPHPYPSDIFGSQAYSGGNEDISQRRYSAATKGGSPRNVSKFNFGEAPHKWGTPGPAPQSPHEASPRRGKASGSLAPYQPPSGYAPWGNRG